MLLQEYYLVIIFKDFVKNSHQSVVDRCNILIQNITKITKLYFYHKNHLGSVIAISDENWNIVENYKYDVYGNILDYTESTIWNDIYYTGREFDKEVGLYYNRARYYSAKLGRFIWRDPIDIVDDINLYAYVGNNPVMYVDLIGTEKVFVPTTAPEHYKRNLLNVDLPANHNDALKEGWTLLNESESVFHSFGAPKWKYNTKFISSDGHREAVYHYETWNLITDPRDMWTYNYYPPSDWINHFRYDIVPYYQFWNDYWDTTTEIQRKARSTETTYEAYSDIQELNHNIDRFDISSFTINLINYLQY